MWEKESKQALFERVAQRAQKTAWLSVERKFSRPFGGETKDFRDSADAEIRRSGGRMGGWHGQVHVKVSISGKAQEETRISEVRMTQKAWVPHQEAPHQEMVMCRVGLRVNFYTIFNHFLCRKNIILDSQVQR